MSSCIFFTSIIYYYVLHEKLILRCLVHISLDYSTLPTPVMWIFRIFQFPIFATRLFNRDRASFHLPSAPNVCLMVNQTNGVEFPVLLKHGHMGSCYSCLPCAVSCLVLWQLFKLTQLPLVIFIAGLTWH